MSAPRPTLRATALAALAAAATLGGCSYQGEAERTAVAQVRGFAEFDRDNVAYALEETHLQPGSPEIQQVLEQSQEGQILEATQHGDQTTFLMTYFYTAQAGGWPSADATARLCVDLVVTSDAHVRLQDSQCPEDLQDGPSVIVTDLGS